MEKKTNKNTKFGILHESENAPFRAFTLKHVHVLRDMNNLDNEK